MTQRLHLVFGGALVSALQDVCRDVSQIHFVGMDPDCATVFSGWKAAAQRRVDNAHMRYFIAHLHRVREDGPQAADAEAMMA